MHLSPFPTPRSCSWKTTTKNRSHGKSRLRGGGFRTRGMYFETVASAMSKWQLDGSPQNAQQMAEGEVLDRRRSAGPEEGSQGRQPGGQGDQERGQVPVVQCTEPEDGCLVAKEGTHWIYTTASVPWPCVRPTDPGDPVGGGENYPPKAFPGSCRLHPLGQEFGQGVVLQPR